MRKSVLVLVFALAGIAGALVSPELEQHLATAQAGQYPCDLAYAPDVLEEPGDDPAPPSDEIPWGVQRVSAPAIWAQGSDPACTS